MDGWAIDSYGLRAAYSQTVLDQLRDTDRLHVSPFTWHPGEAEGSGQFGLAFVRPRERSWQLALVDSEVSRPSGRAADLDARLRELHARGVLILAGEHECDPQFVAEVETSWQDAGLVGRPTDETFSAVMTAGRLGIDLITEDSDVRKLAHHWQVHPVTVTEFAAALAA